MSFGDPGARSSSPAHKRARARKACDSYRSTQIPSFEKDGSRGRGDFYVYHSCAKHIMKVPTACRHRDTVTAARQTLRHYGCCLEMPHLGINQTMHVSYQVTKWLGRAKRSTGKGVTEVTVARPNDAIGPLRPRVSTCLTSRSTFKESGSGYRRRTIRASFARHCCRSCGAAADVVQTLRTPPRLTSTSIGHRCGVAWP